MADQLQFRGGTTAATNLFVGAARELTIDTDRNTLVVHDGDTAGGHVLVKETHDKNIVINTVHMGRGQNNLTGNTGVGANTLQNTITGNDNTALGYYALSEVNTGAGNICIGKLAGSNITTGSNNTIIGNYPATTVTSGVVVVSAGTNMRIFVDNQGDVGIATDSPSYRLDVRGGSIGIVEDNNLIWHNAAGTERGRISVSDGNIMTFDVGSGTRAVTINSTAQVGLGTSQPAYPVHIASATGNAVMALQPGTTTTDCQIKYINSSGVEKGVLEYDISSNTHRMYAEGSEVASFNATAFTTAGVLAVGGVALTENSINKSISVRGTSSSIIIQETTTSTNHKTELATKIDGNFAILNGTNERVTVATNGNVGINQTTPSSQLDVNGIAKVDSASVVADAVIDGNTPGAGMHLAFGSDGTDNTGTIDCRDHTTDPVTYHKLRAMCSEFKVQKNAGPNFIVEGTAVRFHNTFSGSGYSSSNNIGGMELTTTQIKFYRSQSQTGTDYDNTLVDLGRSGRGSIIQGRADGSLILGGSGATISGDRSKILQLRPTEGVVFTTPTRNTGASGTAALNMFDQGTFTPSLFAQDPAPDSGYEAALTTSSYASREGYYTRAGNCVMVSGSIRLMSTNSLLTDIGLFDFAAIGGLPYAGKSGQDSFVGGGVIHYHNNVDATTSNLNDTFYLNVPSGDSVLSIWNSDNTNYPDMSKSVLNHFAQGLMKLSFTATYFI